MTEHDTVHEAVQLNNAAGEDIASILDAETLCTDAPVQPNGHADFGPQHALLLADAKRYRKRAQAAEQALETFKIDLAARETKLQEQEQTIAELQTAATRHAIDAALREAQAIDAEAARVLAESALAEMPQPDVAQAVDELRRRRPYLFARSEPRAQAASGAMSAASADGRSAHSAQLTDAAADAITTGKRSDLLRYLRLKRRA